MTASVQLPVVNEMGNYEIRLESIGGLGANLCGKMLGELGLKQLHLNSASFSSYGSEKTGTPVTAYIRYCDWEKDIRVHSPVIHPHLLGIFHDALLSDANVLSGCTADTVIVLHTSDAPDRTADRLRLLKTQADFRALYTLPAQQIARETHSRINVVMLGAMVKAMGFVPLTAAEEIVSKTLGKKYPDALAANLAGLRGGYEAAAQYPTSADPASVPDKMPPSDKPAPSSKAAPSDTGNESNITTNTNGCTRKTAFENPGDTRAPSSPMPIGGLNPHFGNSVTNDLSPSRQGFIPLFVQERCINCGLCDSTCPDMVFQFKKGTYRGRDMMVNRGLDYYHCKGCLRCVEVCPTQALVKGLEAEHPHKEWFLPNQELIRKLDYYEKTGADGYITSEAYLTEKELH